MVVRILAVCSLLLLPLSVSLWHRSHRYPQQHRYDVTLYKSLWIYLRDGTCGLYLLNMPTKTASRSEDFHHLHYDPVPRNRSLYLSSTMVGPYRHSWLAFPLWASTTLLAALGVLPLTLGPLRRWRRRRNGWCLHCGYNLNGNRSGRCPECGLRHARPRRRTLSPSLPGRG